MSVAFVATTRLFWDPVLEERKGKTIDLAADGHRNCDEVPDEPRGRRHLQAIIAGLVVGKDS